MPRDSLRFSPTAWAKLLCLRDLGPTEVGGFGISAADDLLYVEDVQLVQQVCSEASVRFDDESVAEFFDRQVDDGLRLERFARIWLHSHPGRCPLPSPLDEETFERAFGGANWAVMFILAQEGQTYCRMRFNVGPGGQQRLAVEVDFSRPFPCTQHAAWQEEYLANVTPDLPPWVLDSSLLELDEVDALVSSLDSSAELRDKEPARQGVVVSERELCHDF